MPLLTKTTRTFTTRRGMILYLKEVPFLLLMDFLDESNAPQPPMIPVANAIGYAETPDFEDKTYIEKRKVYDSERSVGLLRLCATFGVSNDPPVDDPTIRALRAIDSRMTPETLKIRWLEAEFTDQDELSTFIEEVVAQTVATEEALDESASEERFRRVGGQGSSNGHSSKKSTANGRLPVPIGGAIESGSIHGDDVD